MLTRILPIFGFAWLLAEPAFSQDTVLTLDQPHTAGISAFRADWDRPISLSETGAVQFVDSVVRDRSPTAAWSPVQRGGRPGVLAFDALNRSLLVRFPGAASVLLHR